MGKVRGTKRGARVGGGVGVGGKGRGDEKENEKENEGGGVGRRIVGAARELLFSRGYRAFTMDDLAGELGMSKKTLYVHFRSKDAMIGAVLDEFAGGLRVEAERLLADRALGFAEKLRGFAGVAVERLGRVSPELLAELQRFAPELNRRVQELRGKNLVYIFGRFIEAGQMSGEVRETVSPVFASEFYLHAMQGLLEPAALQRLRVGPKQVFENAMRIFFGGLLTPAGQKDYEKLFPH